MTGIRLDKWLWAARFFKTRTLAAKACELGRIEANHQPARSVARSPGRRSALDQKRRRRLRGGGPGPERRARTRFRCAAALSRNRSQPRSAQEICRRAQSRIALRRRLPPVALRNAIAAASFAFVVATDRVESNPDRHVRPLPAFSGAVPNPPLIWREEKIRAEHEAKTALRVPPGGPPCNLLRVVQDLNQQRRVSWLASSLRNRRGVHIRGRAFHPRRIHAPDFVVVVRPGLHRRVCVGRWCVE